VDKPLIFAEAKINRLPTLISPFDHTALREGNGNVECLRRNRNNILYNKKTVEKGGETG